MVTKSFDHLLNKFNSLNTMLRKIEKTRIFNEDVHVINFFSWYGWGQAAVDDRFARRVTLNTITYCYL